MTDKKEIEKEIIEEELIDDKTVIELDDKLHRQINISKPEVQIVLSTECREETLDDLMERAIYLMDTYGSKSVID